MSRPVSKRESRRGSKGRFVGGMVTAEQATDLLSRNRAGESERVLAAEVGCAPSYMHTILKRAAEAEAGAKAPVRVGLQRTAREALEAIINDRDAKHSDVVAAARALDALKAEPLDGEDAARPTALVVSGPVVCPVCGHDLRPVRQAELEAKLARFSEIPGKDTPPGNQDDPRF